jgi:hypothetical protein
LALDSVRAGRCAARLAALKLDCRVRPYNDEGSYNDAASYFTACGLSGEPVPPVMMSGEPQKKNS